MTSRRLQRGDACGNLNEACCYGDAATPLCGAGICDPTHGDPTLPLPNESNHKAWPCLCTNTRCVVNSEHCPPGAICDQTAILEECGGLGEPCCTGIECNEDDEDDAGNIIVLSCNADFFDDATGQSTRCEAEPEEVLDQSFGVGGPGEKCNNGACKANDPELACRGALFPAGHVWLFEADAKAVRPVVQQEWT